MFCSWMTHSTRWLQWKIRPLLSHPVSPWTCLGSHQSKVTGRARTLSWRTVGEISVVFAVWIVLPSHWTPVPLPLGGLTRVACSWILTSCLTGQHILKIALIDALITSTGSTSLPCSSFFSLYCPHYLSLFWFCELIWCVKPQPSTSNFQATFLANLVYLF